MRADWACGYAIVEEPTSSTKAADSSSPALAQTDSSSEEPDISGEIADTAVEVLVPAAIIPSETPTVTASPEQMVPVTSPPFKETRASTSATTLGVAVVEEGGPAVITHLVQYIRSSRIKQGE